MAFKVNSTIKINLKEILREKGVTSKELAERLGVTPVTISYIVTNKTTPSLDMLCRIAKELNVKLSTLLGEEPLKVIDTSKEFAAFVRYKGIHYTADTLDEFFKQVDELKAIAR
jgi:transcriptional regulator with XRE-family HTH domain